MLEANQKLQKLNQLNQEQYAQILKYKILNSEFNFKDLTCQNMVEKLLVVTEDPHEIWNSFEEFQPGFFAKVLMRQFNIEHDFSEVVMNDFRQ